MERTFAVWVLIGCRIDCEGRDPPAYTISSCAVWGWNNRPPAGGGPQDSFRSKLGRRL